VELAEILPTSLLKMATVWLSLIATKYDVQKFLRNMISLPSPGTQPTRQCSKTLELNGMTFLLQQLAMMPST
jgi:hypothetical protein